MAKPSPFLGATAPWMTDADDEFVYPQTKHMAANQLREALRARLQALQDEDLDAVLLETRRQIAEAGVTGDVTRAGDLAEMALDLVAAKEHARRL